VAAGQPAAARPPVERDAAEARLALLQSQLEPHMLFNTLANLRALIASDPLRAQTMLDQLIAFLRATLGASRTTLHPLADELARLDDYLHLMQCRMGARLQARLDLPDDLAALPVPPLVLQPLVENAIKHGLEPHVAGGRLDVSAMREAGELVLRVRDTGAGLSRASTGSSHFGLQQVRERLVAMYGAAASLDLAAAADGDGGTLATIRMPMRDAAARPHGRPRHATVQSDP
jgi:sensor histidine kinase YesM